MAKKKFLDLAGTNHLVDKVTGLVNDVSEVAEKASLNVVYIGGTLVDSPSFQAGKAPVKAGEGGSELYLIYGTDELCLKYQNKYYANWKDAETFGEVSEWGVHPSTDYGVSSRIYVDLLAREIYLWEDGFEKVAGYQDTVNLKKVLDADVLMKYQNGDDELSIGEQVYQNKAQIGRLDEEVSDNSSEISDLDERIQTVIANLGASSVRGKTFAEAIEDNATDIESLESTLQTVLDSDGVKGVIDTFKDMEDFLQGITDTTTLTALLQEQQKLLGGRNVVYLDSFVNNVGLTHSPGPSAGTGDSTLVYDKQQHYLLLKLGDLYYMTWTNNHLVGEAESGATKPSSSKLYIVLNVDGVVGVYVWNGTDLVEIHEAALNAMAERIQALEDAEPESITTAEIDAMFDGYSMSGPEPVAPTN